MPIATLHGMSPLSFAEHPDELSSSPKARAHPDKLAPLSPGLTPDELGLDLNEDSTGYVFRNGSHTNFYAVVTEVLTGIGRHAG